MEEFKIRDKNTGMLVTVRGDTPPPVEALPEIFSKARKGAEAKLNDGAYRFDSDFKELDKDTQRQRVAELSAQAIGTSPDEIDVTGGMGLWERTKLDLLPDEPSKMEYLEKKFGQENVNMLNIGGKPKMFYRDPKTKKMTMVDEMGASLADFTADIAGEAVTTVGAIGGAVAGTALAPGLGTVAGATAGAALGGFLTGVGQDVAAEVATGQDIELGQKVKQRGLEAAIGVPIDLATAGVGRIFSRGVAGRGANALQKEIDSAFTRVENSNVFKAQEVSLQQPSALRTGAGSRQASEIAAARPTSKLAKQLSEVRDTMGLYRSLASGENMTSAGIENFNRVADNLRRQYAGVVDEIAQTDKQLAKEISEGLSRKSQKLLAPKVSEEEVGGRIRELLAPGVNRIEETNAANFQLLRELGQDTTVPTGPIIRAIENAEAGFARLSDPTSRKIAKELKGRGNITFQELREVIDQVGDSVSMSKEAGFSTRERVATQALNNLRDVRGQLASQNPQLQEALDTAIGFYQNNLLATKRSAVGKALREQLADPAISQSQVAKLAIQDPAYIRQALSIAEQSGGPEATQLKKSLQDLYMNRIGLDESFDASKGFNFDEDIVRELFGNRAIRDLANLQKRMKQAKGVKVADISREDVYELFSAYSGNEKGRIMAKIVQRAKQQSRMNKMLNAKLLKKLQPKKGAGGEWLEPDMTGFDLAKFSKGFVDATPSQVDSAVKALKAQGDELGLQAFRQSYIGNLFDRFASNAQVDRFGNPLWNPEAFQQATKSGSPMLQNLETILGKDGAQEILSANRVLLEAAATKGGQVAEVFQPRYSIASGGLQFYGVGNLIGGLRGRALAWAYGSNVGSKLMKFLANPATDAETEAMLKTLLPALMTTSGGLKAIGVQGQFDPEFAERIAPLFEAPQVSQ